MVHASFLMHHSLRLNVNEEMLQSTVNPTSLAKRQVAAVQLSAHLLATKISWDGALACRVSSRLESAPVQGVPRLPRVHCDRHQCRLYFTSLALCQLNIHWQYRRRGVGVPKSVKTNFGSPASLTRMAFPRISNWLKCFWGFRGATRCFVCT